MTDPTEPPVRSGDVLAGKYRVERVLGAGGIGVVVSAKHLALGERVALKFLLPESSKDEETKQRFLREARAMVRIKSEHVVRVADVGTLETGAPFLVMEYLTGTDLFDLLRKQGPLAVDVALDYVLQASVAIAEAHALGIVHRDLKPANLFLTERLDGSKLVKVLDFGLAKDVMRQDAPQRSLTDLTKIMGTPAYMSPEQIRSTKLVDERGDVWAIAVILYELLAGRQPFERPTLHGMMAAIMMDPPPSLRALRPDVPPELEQAIFACLEKDREQRTASIAAFAEAVAPFAAPRSRGSVERIVGLSRASRPALDDTAPSLGDVGEALRPKTRSDWSSTQRDVRRRSPLVLVIGAGAAVAVLGIVVLVVLSLRRPEPTEVAPSPVTESSASPAESAPPVVAASESVAPPAPPPPASTETKKKTTRAAPPPAPPSTRTKGDVGRVIDTRK